MTGTVARVAGASHARWSGEASATPTLIFVANTVPAAFLVSTTGQTAARTSAIPLVANALWGNRETPGVLEDPLFAFDLGQLFKMVLLLRVQTCHLRYGVGNPAFVHGGALVPVAAMPVPTAVRLAGAFGAIGTFV